MSATLSISKLFEHIIKLESLVEERLKQNNLKAVVLHKLADKLAELTVYVDISDYTMESVPCLHYEDVEYHCGTVVSENCDSNEEECEKKFRQCVGEEIRDFIEQHKYPPFRFKYSNLSDIEAEVRTEKDDEGRKICVRDYLLVRWKWKFPENVEEIIDSINVEYTVDYILSHVLRLVEAVKALA